MNAIRKAFNEDPVMAAVAVFMLGIVAVILLAAAVIYIPHILTSPLGEQSQSANSLTQFASFIMMIAGLVAVHVDRRAKGSKSVLPFSLPRRIAIGVTIEIHGLFNPRRHQVVWAM